MEPAVVPPVVSPAPPVVESVPPVVAPVTKKGDGKKKAVDPEANEPVNYDIVDDPDAPIEVTGAEIDGVLRPFRPAASECGKSNGVPLGTDIGVKMLLASDGKLTNVQATDRPAGDPAVQCILGLIKGAKLELGARTKVTSAFFNYSFKVY